MESNNLRITHEKLRLLVGIVRKEANHHQRFFKDARERLFLIQFSLVLAMITSLQSQQCSNHVLKTTFRWKSFFGKHKITATNCTEADDGALIRFYHGKQTSHTLPEAHVHQSRWMCIWLLEAVVKRALWSHFSTARFMLYKRMGLLTSRSFLIYGIK